MQTGLAYVIILATMINWLLWNILEDVHCMLFYILFLIKNTTCSVILYMPTDTQIDHIIQQMKYCICKTLSCVPPIHPSNICAPWMLNSSTLSNQSPAAKHFLVDFSGFSLHRLTHWLSKECVTPIILIVIVVWECGRIRSNWNMFASGISGWASLINHFC